MKYKTCKDYNLIMHLGVWQLHTNNTACYPCRKNNGECYGECYIVSMINNVINAEDPRKWLSQHYININNLTMISKAVIEQLPEKYKELYEKLLILK